MLRSPVFSSLYQSSIAGLLREKVEDTDLHLCYVKGKKVSWIILALIIMKCLVSSVLDCTTFWKNSDVLLFELILNQQKEIGDEGI